MTVTLDAVFRSTVADFKTAGINDPAEDARHLISGVLGLTLTEMVTEARRVIDETELTAIDAAVSRRKAHEPVYRILGAREFYGLDFMLSPETLEPRPDTEILVERSLAFLTAAAGKGPVRFADLGTGTGAIAISLLRHCDAATAVATDIAEGALETARANALINGVADRFEPLKSAWFSSISERFDMIVSNPPYIGSAEIAKLAPEVRMFDPLEALDGGIDGLDAYRAIAAGAADHLKDDGVVALEIGFDQKAEVIAVFERNGFTFVDAARDLGGNDRVVVFATPH